MKYSARERESREDGGGARAVEDARRPLEKVLEVAAETQTPAVAVTRRDCARRHGRKLVHLPILQASSFHPLLVVTELKATKKFF